MTRPAEVNAALHAVTRARDVERLSEGYAGMPPGRKRAKRQELMRATEQRILEAVHAGASSADIAQALGQNMSWTRKRIWNAKVAAGEPVRAAGPPSSTGALSPMPSRPVEPDELAVDAVPDVPVTAPNVWLDVPRCATPLPWPAGEMCRLDRGHAGPHIGRRRDRST